jgi:hypothetical protein
MGMMYSYLWLTPGPKMMWQFDELGYDYSINHCVNGTVNNACRLDNKPVRWDYWTANANRKKLYFINAMLIHLKTNYSDVNKPSSYNLSANNKYKRLQLNGSGFTTLVYGSTDVAPQTVTPSFPFTGTWYDYLNGDSLVVTNTNQTVSYKAGEYHVWTSKRIKNPFLNTNQSGVKEVMQELVQVYPNPSNGKILANWEGLGEFAKFELYDMAGKRVVNFEKIEKGILIDLGNMNGVYSYKITVGEMVQSGKLILQ